MRFRVVIIFFILALFGGFVALWPSASLAQQNEQPAGSGQAAGQGLIRQNVNLVNVLFSVFDQQNRIVSNLQQKDFKVFDDKTPQEIRFFSRQTGLPLRVGLLLDTSNSIRERLQFEKDAAVDFVYKVIRRDTDQAFLMSVDGLPEVVQGFTSNLDRLRDSIMRQRAGGGTALYDAIYTGCETLLDAPVAPGAEGELRRVLVVISDGDDNLSRHTLREALDMAERADILVYTISTSTNWLVTDEETSSVTIDNRKFQKGPGDQVLQRFADESGGRAFFPYRASDLAVSFARIGDELRSQYSLAYVLPRGAPDGKFHNIRIVVDEKKVRVRARRGYYATPPAISVISAPAG